MQTTSEATARILETALTEYCVLKLTCNSQCRTAAAGKHRCRAASWRIFIDSIGCAGRIGQANSAEFIAWAENAAPMAWLSSKHSESNLAEQLGEKPSDTIPTFPVCPEATIC
jgi:hypothetical protein